MTTCLPGTDRKRKILQCDLYRTLAFNPRNAGKLGKYKQHRRSCLHNMDTVTLMHYSSDTWVYTGSYVLFTGRTLTIKHPYFSSYNLVEVLCGDKLGFIERHKFTLV